MQMRRKLGKIINSSYSENFVILGLLKYNHLKSFKDLMTVKELNEFLRFSVKLVIANYRINETLGYFNCKKRTKNMECLG